MLMLFALYWVMTQFSSPCSATLGCKTPLGMESGDISSAQISASSMLDADNSPEQARLHKKADGGMAGAWSAQIDDFNQWLQVDLSSYTKVSRVATQGKNGFDQWVTKYKIQYSDDGETFLVYKEPGTSSAKVTSFMLFLYLFYD